VSNDAPAFDAPTPDAPTGDARRRRGGRRIRRGPILFVVVAALVAAVVAQQDEPSPSVASTASRAAHAGLGVPAADVASSAWYCAAGTSTTDGDATETVVIASLARTDIEATITVMPGGDDEPAQDTMRLAPGEQVSVPVADVLATAEPGVVVETGGPAAVSHVLEHGDDVAVESCTRTAAADWYFASGTTVEGSQHDLLLFNPFGADAIVDVSFVTDTGAQEPAALQAMVVPRRSRVTVPVQDSVLRQARVAAHVHARTGRIVAEQTQTFDDVAVDGVARDGIALSAGATAPATVWRIPAGSTRDAGRVQLALANFSRENARVDVKAIVADGQDVPAQTLRVGGQDVVLVDVTTRVPLDRELAVTVTARAVDGRRVPVVAEILATWPSTSASAGLGGTVGSTLQATRWVVPVPDVDAPTTITIFNPGPHPVTAAVLAADLVDRRVGATSEPERAIAPGEAKTVQLAAGRAAPMVVTADHPVVVGATVLGDAGAAVTEALPDLAHGDTAPGASTGG
jgi:hypothetical protein